MKTTRFFVFLLLTLNSVDGNAQSNTNARDTTRGLKDYYSNLFPIGVSVSPQNLEGPEAKLIEKQFNSLTPENVMKPGLIHPREDQYQWDQADKIVNFAQQHHMRVRGHTLCWHQQTGDWMFKDSSGKPTSKEVLLRRLEDHIHQVVTRYKGKIYAWDVVNEAIADDSLQFLRDTPWLRICGKEFIAKAFDAAHRADPDALLFYNEYNSERPEKRERIYKLLKELIDAGVPVHGVGLQGHWSIYEPSEVGLRKSIERFSSLGLKVQVTELDVSVYPWEKLTRNLKPNETGNFTATLEQQQIEQYKMIFRVLRDYKGVITGVTFWNVSDRHTWLDSYPVRGRKNYPLLFDIELRPKKAYWAVVKF